MPRADVIDAHCGRSPAIPRAAVISVGILGADGVVQEDEVWSVKAPVGAVDRLRGLRSIEDAVDIEIDLVREPSDTVGVETVREI